VVHILHNARVIISGSRDFDRPKLLRAKLDKYLVWMDRPNICTGGQRQKIGVRRWIGADYFGELWAHQWHFLVSIFHADWQQYGKAAGMIRNREMVNYAAEEGNGYAVFFWDGSSPGTKHTMDLAKKAGLKVRVVYYLEEDCDE